jgi:hypothetical protein
MIGINANPAEPGIWIFERNVQNLEHRESGFYNKIVLLVGVLKDSVQ